MRFLAVVLRHTSRNMLHTWKSQLMTLCTVALSVLIFAFFYLIYYNALHLGEELGDDLRLVVYLDEDPAQSSYFAARIALAQVLPNAVTNLGAAVMPGFLARIAGRFRAFSGCQ